MKTLIVDDSPIIRKSLEIWLKKFDFEVIGQAYDGQVGIEMVDSLKPELVTLDLTLPKLDGMKVLEHIKDVLPATHILVISAVDSQDTILKALKLGANGYLKKPFNADELKVELEKINSVNR